MLKDFAKLQTFMVVIKEKSFSKASAKLGISQPAVTQQIKFIEDYLETKIVERKKNGIKLTKEGEDLFRIAQRLEKAIISAEKELLQIIKKEFTFVMGASFAIGNYVLPNYLGKIKEKIDNEVHIKVDLSERIIDEVLDKKIDIAMIESPVMKEGLIYREWLEDELVFFSNQPIPKQLRPEDLKSFAWICRNEESHTRRMVAEVFDEVGVDCKQFDVRAVVDNSTAVKEGILRSNTNDKPTVSVMSRHVIEEDVKAGRLFEARIKGYKIVRHFFIVYSKDRKHDAFIDNVVNFLFTIKP
ncbi:MAG: LysR family transcriptional regulator [Sulfuricurvum sp. PC08-66]|nr:MAG: LysR family transcriptional regulator [Sulfuricurvum sp. PC08-66]